VGANSFRIAQSCIAHITHIAVAIELHPRPPIALLEYKQLFAQQHLRELHGIVSRTSKNTSHRHRTLGWNTFNKSRGFTATLQSCIGKIRPEREKPFIKVAHT
jgi:hypothetical protein